MVTTDNDFTGVVGNPIIEYHTSDGTNYSDFMEVFFVAAPSNYTENEFMSAGDIKNSGAEVSPSGAVLNLPVVPTNATLQHPREGGTTAAPIQPTLVWYKGQEVWTYVFEVTTTEASTLNNGIKSCDATRLSTVILTHKPYYLLLPQQRNTLTPPVTSPTSLRLRFLFRRRLLRRARWVKMVKLPPRLWFDRFRFGISISIRTE